MQAALSKNIKNSKNIKKKMKQSSDCWATWCWVISLFVIFCRFDCVVFRMAPLRCLSYMYQIGILARRHEIDIFTLP